MTDPPDSIYVYSRRFLPSPLCSSLFFCIFLVLLTRPLILPYLLYLAEPWLTASCSAFKHPCFPDIRRCVGFTNPLVGLLLIDSFSAPIPSPSLLHSLYFPRRYFLKTAVMTLLHPCPLTTSPAISSLVAFAPESPPYLGSSLVSVVRRHFRHFVDVHDW